MQASSLLLLQDRSTGAVDLKDLSDQAIMEACVDGFIDTCKKNFKHQDGTYKDVCKWSGIRCNGRRQVTQIIWISEEEIELDSVGTLSLASLPRHLKDVIIEMGEPKDVLFTLELANNDTSALPRGLQSFELENVDVSGSLDLRRLPPNMKIFKANSCAVSGRCYLSALPKNLQRLLLSINALEGSVCLDRLPPSLTQIDLSFNVLSGTINLKHLPSMLTWMSLSNNQFCGSVDADYLPRDMYLMQLQDNEISGIIFTTRPPKNLKWLRIGDNAFTGVSIVSRKAFAVVEADFRSMKTVDEHGVLYTEEDFARNDSERQDWLREEYLRIKDERSAAV